MSTVWPAAGGALVRGGLVALALAGGPSGTLSAQLLEVGGYVLGVAAHSREGAVLSGGTSLVSRARIMPRLAAGPVSLDVAYEHVLTRSPPGGGFSLTASGSGAADTEWLDLGWTLEETERTAWRHAFDRLSLTLHSAAVDVTIGRQAISWATTLFLTPADPFAPFNPSDPFREYRGGVDAVRVRAFPGPFSEVELVVRGAKSTAGRTLTALARAQAALRGWSVGGWTGVLHDQVAGALFVAGAAGATAVRAEASFRKAPVGGRGARLRAAVGLDRRFSVAGRDLYGVFEYQHDGLAAASSSGLLEVADSRAFARGELQTLGANTCAVQAAYQLHPLVSVDMLVLANLADGSVLFSPGASWSATSSATVRVGLFSGLGPDGFTGPPGAPGASFRSEYGIVPDVAYVSLSWFF